MEYDYDIVFLGGGLNYAGAVVASKARLKCALVEKNPAHLGGTCLHNGCIPSKMYLAAADTVRASKKAHFSGSLSLDMAKLDEEKEALLARATKAIMKQCENVEIVEGEGVLTAPHTIEADGKTVTGRYVIIGTGSRPFIPEGIVYDSHSVITSDEVLNMREFPERIAIYGDGAIGLEMASFFASVGVETELIWRHDTLLRKAHPKISENAMKQMEALGVTLLPDHSIETAKKAKKGVHIRFSDGSEHHVPKLLVATGRRPNVEAVRNDAVAVDKRGIVTDEHFETTCKDHYAVGDCNGKLQLAHAARAEVLYVVRQILGEKPEPLNLNHVVKFIHTLPCSYAVVGETRSELEKRGVEYKESVVPLSGLPFPHTHDGDLGVMVVYADEDRFIMGGEVFCPGAEEIIAVVSMALAGEMDVKLARRTILAHPTFSESLERAFDRL
ncbi:dihydrolipoyl dehydrogenase family protein [Hydrogenimonas cancrithermarum]|uniref:Dihydrolipoyl dehydrogenase n=1 Tax=Hydrogenimonas cancrithermarum TaxID=2993563 RepID=A0ABN6WS40_9BACT|nr:NAD(P)/FAD-dependent oxidoreductase [Hydrogenimonas cancrithermarum]BDY11757.1 dihydrolipoyl dehydrogenase [Hydrogenimonas cancrithermarum]